MIAMLEGMIALLKAPAINKKHTSKVFSWMARILKRGVERGMERQVSEHLEAAVNSGTELLSKLDEFKSAADLTKLL
ncbi:MAG: hypothetical protein ACK4M6_13170 [Hyphomonas sp.]